MPAVDRLLLDHDEFLQVVWECLLQAQQRDKSYYDAEHRDVSFDVEQKVWLRLHHRPAASITCPGRGKLSPRFYGPYKLIARIDSVAYRVELPPKSRLHDVFHVSMLEPFRGEPPVTLPPLPVPDIHHGRFIPRPSQVLKARLSRGTRQLLVQWEGQDPAQASWVDFEDFKQCYLEWQLEDDLLVDGGSDVMWGCTYVRRRKESGGQPS
jgi:hypothetical protein